MSEQPAKIPRPAEGGLCWVEIPGKDVDKLKVSTRPQQLATVKHQLTFSVRTSTPMHSPTGLGRMKARPRPPKMAESINSKWAIIRI
jgi:hypothetical protein